MGVLSWIVFGLAFMLPGFVVFLALHVVASGQERFVQRNAAFAGRLAPGKWWHDPAQFRLPHWLAAWAA